MTPTRPVDKTTPVYGTHSQPPLPSVQQFYTLFRVRQEIANRAEKAREHVTPYLSKRCFRTQPRNSDPVDNLCPSSQVPATRSHAFSLADESTQTKRSFRTLVAVRCFLCRCWQRGIKCVQRIAPELLFAFRTLRFRDAAPARTADTLLLP